MKITMMCGGVGGARAALALYENLPPEDLTFIVNTGDDFVHLGLEIWPDWDTVVYHLSGLGDLKRGWGRADEGTFIAEELKRLDAPDWFHLGDRDLALHIYRNWAQEEGRKRSDIAQHVCQRWGIKSLVLPVTEHGSSTRLTTTDGRTLEFQEWFVKLRCGPTVSEVTNTLQPLTEGVEQALRETELLLMAPSNPYLSLGPMLAHPEVAALIREAKVPKLAISPLIGGKAVKGPLDSLIESLSPHQGQQAIAHYWGDWVDALLLPADEADLEDPPLTLLTGPTLLNSPASRKTFCERMFEVVGTL